MLSYIGKENIMKVNVDQYYSFPKMYLLSSIFHDMDFLLTDFLNSIALS